MQSRLPIAFAGDRPSAFDVDLPRLPAALASLVGLAILALLCGCSSFAASGLNAQGVRLFDQARYPEAIQQFQQALDSDPANADAHYNLAAAYHRLGKAAGRQGDLNQAETYYQLCLARNPGHAECHRGLAVLLAEQNRREESFRLIQAWIDRDPQSPDARIEMARLSEEFGEPEMARRHLADALLLEPQNPRALAAVGRLSEQSGNVQMAMSSYQQSLQADRFQPEVAARLAALQSTTNARSFASGTDGTRLANQPGTGLR